GGRMSVQLRPRHGRIKVGKAALSRLRCWLPALAVTLALLAAASLALARPGGGQTFGGRSSGGGSSGKGGGDCGAVVQIVLFLVELTFEHPAIGIPLDILIIAVIVWAWRSKAKANKQREWDTSQTAFASAASSAPRPSRSLRKQLFLAVTNIDP